MSKLVVIGLLLCLTAIFYSDLYWLGLSGLEFLPRLSRWIFPAGVITSAIGLKNHANHETH